MSHSIVIFLAPGFEEIEALAPADIFRRAGQQVSLCAVNHGAGDEIIVSGAHGIKVQCDCHISRLEPSAYDVAYCPGGMPGAANLAKDSRVLDALQHISRASGLLCAICAAPIVLEAAGILTDDSSFTCYPGFESQIPHGRFTNRFIQKSGRILTACGPGASLEFALEILRAIGETAIVTSLADGMQMHRN